MTQMRVFTSSEIHCLSFTFVRKVESRVVQNESENNKKKSQINS